MPARRRALCVLLLLCALLSACGGGGNSATPTPSDPPTAAVPTVAPTSPASTPESALPPDTLRWSLDGVSDVGSLDPARPGDLQTTPVLGLVFGGLVRLDENLEVVPDGAQDWKISADGTVYTFTLRDGLAFADGTPVTASDFVYSINRALSPETASYGAPTQLAHILGAQDVLSGTTTFAFGVRALNPQTLEIRLDAPLAYFLTQLVYSYTFVVPRALVDSGRDWEQRAYGTGPYRVTEWKRGAYLQLTANENYWAGKPGIPKITIPFNPDSERAFQSYLAGELDIVGNQQSPLPSQRLAQAKELPGFASTPSLATRFVSFNNRRAPFDNVEVRRAFALAVDKRALVTKLLPDAATPADRILPPGLLGTQYDITPLAFDAALAREALTNAGYPGGEGLPEITLTYAIEGENEAVVRELQQQWRDNLGVEVKLQSFPDTGSFGDVLDTTFLQPETGLQLFLSFWGIDYPDPQNFLSQQFLTNSSSNNGRFSNPTFDRLVGEADGLGDRSAIERRLLLYNQAEQIVINEAAWIPLYHPSFNILIRPRVEGLRLTPYGLIVPDWTQVKLKANTP
ncbi:MAG TPA: peptide ABC transporter substrate-binding protein [Roseiflexaceae bacterium]|nr:peptide ABC transporter substrate-binding protein [Roseiflexaceae bacterium]